MLNNNIINFIIYFGLFPDKSHLDLFSNRPQPKKKRKSRTAFTNHQIFELEKRFLYQKYLSPADRDEIAASLGLSNAQVITWFQNRRAKQKRDIEELKKDFESVKVFSGHKSFLENVNDLSILKKKPLHPDAVVMEGLAAAAAAGMMPVVTGSLSMQSQVVSQQSQPSLPPPPPTVVSVSSNLDQRTHLICPVSASLAMLSSASSSGCSSSSTSSISSATSSILVDPTSLSPPK